MKQIDFHIDDVAICDFLQGNKQHYYVRTNKIHAIILFIVILFLIISPIIGLIDKKNGYIILEYKRNLKEAPDFVYFLSTFIALVILKYQIKYIINTFIYEKPLVSIINNNLNIYDNIFNIHEIKKIFFENKVLERTCVIEFKNGEFVRLKSKKLFPHLECALAALFGKAQGRMIRLLAHVSKE